MNPSGLSLLRGPCIIQQYRDHSATFYKAYVIDNDVMVYRRPSLPDLDRYRCLERECPPHHQSSKDGDTVTSQAIEGIKSIVFDSRYAYPTIEDFLVRCDMPLHGGEASIDSSFLSSGGSSLLESGRNY